ncbi:hypothetical protein V5O48_007048 [Marasmius crinis-equi]|uniref:FAD-binding PCMH-type domain-containing protein n=1 Tax=Marasmius crinis-equi TaxID=585013 RepID=A0ABR3FHY0_9AGAR
MSSEVSPQNSLSPDLVKELTALIKGHVYPRDDSNFFEYTAMFNGNVQSPAKAVTCPLDAEDVSKVVLFCRKHSFSLSVKAGGFGTAGWAVGGDIVIDLSRMVEVDIELPKEDGSYTGLRNIPTAHSKGKRPITDVDTKPSNSSPGKRRREEDNDLRNYDLASPSAAAFLRGESSSSDHSPHVIRRRISEHTYVSGSSSYTSEANGSTVRNGGNGNGTNGSGNSNGQSSSSSSSTVTSRASSSNGSSQTPRAPVTTNNSGAPINADPFGYLNGPTKDIPTMQSNFARPDAFNPPVQAWLFELAGGAIADYEDTCVPKTQREATFTVAALHQWDMGINDLRCITTAEEWIADTLKPVQTGGPLPSFLGRHESPTRTIACFGKNWDRLKELKGKYDPANVFRNSLWPLGADGEIVEPQTHEPLTPDEAGTSFDHLVDVKGKGKDV